LIIQCNPREEDGGEQGDYNGGTPEGDDDGGTSEDDDDGGTSEDDDNGGTSEDDDNGGTSEDDDDGGIPEGGEYHMVLPPDEETLYFAIDTLPFYLSRADYEPNLAIHAHSLLSRKIGSREDKLLHEAIHLYLEVSL